MSSTNKPGIPTRGGYNNSSDRSLRSSSSIYPTSSTITWLGSISKNMRPNPEESSTDITSDANLHEKSGDIYQAAAKAVTPRRWRPGVKSNLPWTFISALLGTIAWVGACIGVILAAHGTQTVSWAVSPTVILAILGPLGSIMLQYALSCGMAITWWNLALSGTTLGALHRQWEYGTSIWTASASGKYGDRIALAKVMALCILVVNPLLQRALTTELSTKYEDAILSTAAPTDVNSLLATNFNFVSVDKDGRAQHISPEIIQITQQFIERKPIVGAISGCTGNCTGTLAAAGIDARCTYDRKSTYTPEYGDQDAASYLFEVGTVHVQKNSTSGIQSTTLSINYAETHADNETALRCRGVWTTVKCDLRHATVAYPFSQRDGVIPSETLRAPIQILETEDQLPSGVATDVIFTGLEMVTSRTLVSFTVLHSSYRFGWEFRFDGLLAGKYLLWDGDNGNCTATFGDPTEEVLSMLHEAMFRIAVAAANATSPRAELVGQQEIMVMVYESRSAYVWVALAITILAVAAVAWTATGFQYVGRPVSLSPLEIANAFGAPMLRETHPGASNMTIAELMKVYQNTQIQYASTDCSLGGPEDTAAGAPSKRLQMGFPGHGTRPQPQELFTG